jgi:hypothetical protein
MIIRMNFGLHGRSFGAPAPVFQRAVRTDLGRSIAQQSPQNKLRIVPDWELIGFASGGGEAYLGVVKTVVRIS